MTARGALALACVALGGCALEVPFEVHWSAPLVAPPGTAAASLPVDLSGQGELWARRAQVRAIHPDSVSLTVVEVGTRTRAETAEVAIHLRPEGVAGGGEQEVALPALTVPLVAGASVEQQAPPGLGDFLLARLLGSGRFSLVVATRSTGPIEATLELTLSGSAAVEP